MKNYQREFNGLRQAENKSEYLQLLLKQEELNFKLLKYADAYYNGTPLITDSGYDVLYDKLIEFQKQTGVIMNNSVTNQIGSSVRIENGLKKSTHEYPLLSLKKVHSTDEIIKFYEKHHKELLIMDKLDGLTVLLTYENGYLVKAETRGDGEVGEDVTHTAYTIANIPRKVPFTGAFSVAGECIVSHKSFSNFNKKMRDNGQSEYAHPRVLASSALRNLDTKLASSVGLGFFAFKLYFRQSLGTPKRQSNFLSTDLDFLTDMGFSPVRNSILSIDRINAAISLQGLSKEYPTDGLVITINDNQYSESLGRTSKYPLSSIAYKFDDDLYETELTGIERSIGRSGRVTYTGVFKPVVIDGTTVTRATLHNRDYIKTLELGIGDKISVKKANMIIPAIVDNETKSNTYEIPKECPECGFHLEFDETYEYCTNQYCRASSIRKIEHFCSKKGVDIKGLSTKTIELLYDDCHISRISHIFHLHKSRNVLIKLKGLSEKTVDDLLAKIEYVKTNTPFHKFICALGIDGVGTTASKELANILDDIDDLIYLDRFEKKLIDNPQSSIKIGGAVHRAIESESFSPIERECKRLVEAGFKPVYNNSDNQKKTVTSHLKDKNFVITGKLNNYGSRSELKDYIESNSGTVQSSVNSKTTYLINNDFESTSSKNKKAQSLGVPIITENDFISMFDSRKRVFDTRKKGEQ